MSSLFAICCILFHFYIKPQPFFIRFYKLKCCILFHFYIKPQPATMHTHAHTRCILFHFYIKPQQSTLFVYHSGVVSYSISTSNHNGGYAVYAAILVVSYSISTSNHNPVMRQYCCLAVVSYSISTSNHNSNKNAFTAKVLYLIPFLHQTTTYGA